MRKVIYTRSRVRNKFRKYPTPENGRLYKNQKNKCVSLRRNSMKTYFKKVSGNGVATNKTFWKFNPFLTKKKVNMNKTTLCLLKMTKFCRKVQAGLTLNDLYDATCMTPNRLLNFYGVYTIMQFVHTKFTKVVLTDYSAFRSSS